MRRRSSPKMCNSLAATPCLCATWMDPAQSSANDFSSSAWPPPWRAVLKVLYSCGLTWTLSFRPSLYLSWSPSCCVLSSARAAEVGPQRYSSIDASIFALCSFAFASRALFVSSSAMSASRRAGGGLLDVLQVDFQPNDCNLSFPFQVKASSERASSAALSLATYSDLLAATTRAPLPPHSTDTRKILSRDAPVAEVVVWVVKATTTWLSLAYASRDSCVTWQNFSNVSAPGYLL